MDKNEENNIQKDWNSTYNNWFFLFNPFFLLLGSVIMWSNGIKILYEIKNTKNEKEN